MKRWGVLYSLVCLIAFLSCEKVVEIPLNDTESQLVVEAVAKNLPGKSYVLLSRSIGAYDSPVGISYLSGAEVTITDPYGEVYVFDEDPFDQGRYVHPTFAVLPNLNYGLKVTYDGVQIAAMDRAKTTPIIDSLFVYQNIGGVGQEPTDTTNILVYTVTDNPVEKNYYRFVLWVNGERENTIFIETDDLGNGETYTSPFFGVSFDSGDSVYAELWSMTKQSYDYFSALNTNLNQGPFSAAPGSLPSNLDAGLGYFGVFMADTSSIIIP